MDHYPLMRPDGDSREAYCANLECLRKQSLAAGHPVLELLLFDALLTIGSIRRRPSSGGRSSPQPPMAPRVSSTSAIGRRAKARRAPASFPKGERSSLRKGSERAITMRPRAH